MTEETKTPRQTTIDRQTEILVSALEKAKDNNGVLLNATEKTFPKFLDKNLRINPVNALMMAMHSDLNDGKTNVYTLFNETKSRGEAVKKGEKGVPFTWTNFNEYINKDNPEDKISRKEYLLLEDKNKESYKVNPKEETNILFNIDQTTMHHVSKEDYDKQIKENGPVLDRENQKAEKDLRIEVNKYILNIRDNLVDVRRDGSGVAYYDAQKDSVRIPAQNTFESYPDYVQEVARQVAHATAIPGRLNREGAVFNDQKSPSEDKQQMEILVEELSSAHKMLELGMPAKLRPATVQQLPQIIEQIKNNPDVTGKVLHDVNRTVGMIKKAENGEKINLVEKPSEARQQKWAEQFPLDKVPEVFSHITMTKDDEGKWALVAKPENERTFAVRPSYEDVSMYFDMIKNDHDEAKTDRFRTQFAQKYYAVVANDPTKELNLFKSKAPQEALDLISKVNAFRSKDNGLYLIATIGEEKQQPVPINQNQWNLMFLADDKKDFKVHLAATLYADVLKEKMQGKENVQTQTESPRLNDALEAKVIINSSLENAVSILPSIIDKYGTDNQIRVNPGLGWNSEIQGFSLDSKDKGKVYVDVYWQGDSTDGNETVALKDIYNKVKVGKDYVIPSDSFFDGNRTREVHSDIHIDKDDIYKAIKDLTKVLDKVIEEEKQKQIKNSPEQKEKERREEKAKEEATKQETKAVANTVLSPILKQFYDLKAKHPDAILLFRAGDFYETYTDDARKTSQILGITLTRSSKAKDKDGKPIEMAGFPYHALDTYLPKLIRAGQRVAICDQIEAPKQSVQHEEKSQEEAKQEQKLRKEETHGRGFHR